MKKREIAETEEKTSSEDKDKFCEKGSEGDTTFEPAC